MLCILRVRGSDFEAYGELRMYERAVVLPNPIMCVASR